MWQRGGPPRSIGYWLTIVATVVFSAGLIAVLFLSARTDPAREARFETPPALAAPTVRPTAVREPARPTVATAPVPALPGLPRATLASPSGVRLTRNRSTITGFADVTSAAPDQRVTLYVTTPAASFQVEVYRLGWYEAGASFASFVDRFAPIVGILQPQPTLDASTGLISAADWAPSGTFIVPANWSTGLYLLKLIAADGDQSYVPLVVRDDSRQHDFVLVHSSATDQAYNSWGGKSLYEFNSSGSNTVRGTPAAVKVSFDRPFDQDGSGGSLRWELNMVRWLEANHFDLGYVSDLDLDHQGDAVSRARAVLIVGHSEYWSKEMRDTLELAHSRGQGLGFFSGDTGAWAVRFEASKLGASRVEVGYKTAPDPLALTDPARSTGHWRDAPLGRPTQTFFGVGTGTGIRRSADWVVSGVDAAAPELFAGTGLRNGDVIPKLVGYEYDGLWTPGAGQRVPDGLRILGTSRVVPIAKPDDLLNVSAEHTLPTANRPPVGTLSTVLETNADNPNWQILVHVRSANRSAYLVYAAGTATEPPRLQVADGEAYGSFSVGDAFLEPGWHVLERNLSADFSSAFDATPEDDARIVSVVLRGSLSIGPMRVTAPGREPVQLDPVRAITANQDGWRIIAGSGRLAESNGPEGEAVLTLDVDIPAGRRSDDAHSVFIPRGSSGAIVATGSIQWSWALNGLDAFGRHADAGGNLTPVDVRVQTLTANLLRALLPSN